MRFLGHVLGLKGLRSAFRRVEDRLDNALLDAGEQTAQSTVTAMQSWTPVDTGALQDSQRVEGGRGERQWRIGPGDEIPYAVYVEYGTSRMAAQPYVQPAAEVARVEFPRRTRREIRRAVTRLGRRRARR